MINQIKQKKQIENSNSTKYQHEIMQHLSTHATWLGVIMQLCQESRGR